MSIKKSSKNPYIGESGDFTFHDSLCVYMDILGFSEMIMDRKRRNLFQIIVNALKESIESLKILQFQIEDKEFSSIKVFTDNIVIGVPITKTQTKALGELIGVVGCVGTFQLKMALKGFFYRGGISKGELHLGDDIVFGEALLDAKNIEENQAISSRIVLNRNIIDDIKSINFPNKKIVIDDYFKETLLKDIDDQFFINYLFFAHKDINKIIIHKNVIEKYLSDHQKTPPVRDKYIWTANYHNYYCETFLEGNDSYHCSIDNSLLKNTFSRLFNDSGDNILSSGH